MVPADDAGGGQPGGRRAGAGVVPAALADRGLAAGAEVGLQGGVLGAPAGERIERAVTINEVIAWRLTAMTLLGRDTPELPAETLFPEIEIATLADFAKDR